MAGHDDPRCLRKPPRSDPETAPAASPVGWARPEPQPSCAEWMRSRRSAATTRWCSVLRCTTSRGRPRRTLSLQKSGRSSRSPTLALQRRIVRRYKRLIGPLTQKEPRESRRSVPISAPREYRVFQGVIQKHQWPFWSRLFFHAFGGRFGDHRDWPTIDAWADRIAVSLPSPRSASQVLAAGPP